MQKVLPVNINTGFTTECWTFLRLAAILSDKKFIPWYIENFNNYFINDTFDVQYYEWGTKEFLCLYDEIVQFEDIADKNNIVEAVINAIDRGGYALLYWDRFYIKGSPQYKKEHFPHDMMVYGYDSDSRVFKFIDINIDGSLWGEHIIGFDSLKCAFENMLEWIASEIDRWTWLYRTKVPACAFFLNRNFDRQPRIDVFYEDICSFLDGGESFGQIKKDGKIRCSHNRFGISGYRNYYEDMYYILSGSNKDYLGMEENKHVLFKMKSLIENKYNLAFKLRYLTENNLARIDEGVFASINKLCGFLDTAFRSSTKYSFTLDKSLLSQARQSFMDAEKLESEILSRVKSCLYDHMKKRLV